MICFSEDIRGGRRNKGARVNMEFTRPCHTSCRGSNINLKFREPRNSKFRIAGELNLKSESQINRTSGTGTSEQVPWYMKSTGTRVKVPRVLNLGGRYYE